MVEPTYVLVGESQKGVRVAVTRCSRHAHIVRAWGVFRPDKVSNIQEIDRVEMRADPAETAVAYIAPHHCPFWIAVEVFCNAGGGWRRSIPRQHGDIAVPHIFAFEGHNLDLDIAYSSPPKE
jgi:hypothetical protein